MLKSLFARKPVPIVSMASPEDISATSESPIDAPESPPVVVISNSNPRKKKLRWLILGLIVLSFGLLLYSIKSSWDEMKKIRQKKNMESLGPDLDEKAKLITKIKEAGWIVVGSQTCHFTRVQKDVFGTSGKAREVFDSIYHEFTTAAEYPLVKHFPTWVHRGSGTTLPGAQVSEAQLNDILTKLEGRAAPEPTPAPKPQIEIVEMTDPEPVKKVVPVVETPKVVEVKLEPPQVVVVEEPKAPEPKVEVAEVVVKEEEEPKMVVEEIKVDVETDKSKKKVKGGKK